MLPLVHKYLIVCVFAASTAAKTLPCRSPPSSPSVLEVERFVKTKFDILIIGGGTAGLALSSRLAEDPSLTVGVIEAGVSHFNDPIVDSPRNSPAGNASYDWMFVSTPQGNAGQRSLPLPRGKMLGGSSGINGLAWGRASTSEYDSWNDFVPGSDWSWGDLLPYMKRSETFSLQPSNAYPGINTAQEATRNRSLPNVDGFTGPIVASYNSDYLDIELALAESMNAVGVKTNAEPQGGNATGVQNTLASFDRVQGMRSYSAPTYYCSHSGLSNYHVLAGAQVTQIVLSRTSAGFTATGVKLSVDKKAYTATASREVVLSAGTIQTPQLLELSGIGNATLLKEHGIDVLVDLPQVGQNLQEHLYATVQWRMREGVDTFDVLRNNATFAAEQAAQYSANHTGFLTRTDTTTAFLPLPEIVDEDRLSSLLNIFDAESTVQMDTPIVQLQEPLIRGWFEHGTAGTIELIQWSFGSIDPVPNQSYVAILGGILHPMSRGTVHITSSDPLVAPAIDPNFLSKDIDTQILLDIVKYVQKLGKTAPFADSVAEQTTPDPSAQTDEQLISYIRSSASGGDHLVGTAAMGSRDSGGVVDGALKVYGTTNLRVVDASVIPIQIACHTQATVYSIAEKAADIIKRAL